MSRLSAQSQLSELRLEIADRLESIGALCRNYGLNLPDLTCIARDPAKPGMIVVVTSETPEGLAEAFRLAMSPDTKEVPK